MFLLWRGRPTKTRSQKLFGDTYLCPWTYSWNSANGEYFRILHEYSSSQNVNSGLNGGCSSSSATRVPSAIYSGPSSRRVGIEQAHAQTRPSAPPLGYDTLINSYTPVVLQPPPYSETHRSSYWFNMFSKIVFCDLQVSFYWHVIVYAIDFIPFSRDYRGCAVVV